jgi:benzoyl-CoA reductase/2-hydroxyglutaryl-CoA dehydratase subunit BcrC/BadD/HgdB
MRYCHERRIYYATHDELDIEKIDIAEEYIDEELHNINLNNLIDAINKSTKENL